MMTVCFVLSGMTTMNAFDVPRSMSPNTLWLSVTRPRLYFRLPNFDLLISKILPGLPIGIVEEVIKYMHAECGLPIVIGFVKKYSAHIFQKKLNQSIGTFCYTLASILASVTRCCLDQRYFSFMMASKESFVLLKKLLLQTLATALHHFRGHLQENQFFLFTI